LPRLASDADNRNPMISPRAALSNPTAPGRERTSHVTKREIKGRLRLGALCAVLLLALPSAVAQAPGSPEATAIQNLLKGMLDPQAGKTDEGGKPGDNDGVKSVDSGLFDVHVRDVEIATVLEMLSYQARTNIVASPQVRGSISANLYSVTLSEALDSVLRPHGFDMQKTGSTIFVGTLEEIAAQQPQDTRVFRLRFLSRDEALKAIQALVSKSGKAVAGGGGGGNTGAAAAGASGGVAASTDASSDYIVVTDSTDRLDRIGKLLERLDERPQQVLIEATILRATLNENNQFGIDFTMLGGIDFQNVSSVSNASSDIATGQTPPGDLQQTTFNANTNLLGNSIAGGFSFGLIKDSLGAFIKALEEVTDVTVVANPKLIGLNRQESEVIVGRRDGYITTTVTETASIQKVEFLETGTQIRIRPIINDDGTVRLAVHPKDSNGGLTASNLPFEETTEAQADILLRDGHTVLIGGLFRERSLHSRSQVPVLGNIPGLGLLFQKQGNATVREEVIILLTIHVLKDTLAEKERFESLLEDVERIRVGARGGIQGLGRERLAQAYYQEALKRFEAGDEERALLNIRMTLHNHPRHLPAIKLREQLLAQRGWDDDGSPAHVFLLNLIRERHPRPADRTPPLGRPERDLQLYEQDTPAKGTSSD
jgi:type IV pilus assembly protein PilQ